MDLADSETRLAPGMSVSDMRTYLCADGRAPTAGEAFFAAHGLSAAGGDDARVVPIDVCWRIFSEHAAVLDDEMHGMFGTRLKLGTTTLLVARMLLADSVFDAALAYKEASALIVPGLAVGVARREGGMSLKWRYEDASAAHLIALEGTAAVYFAILSWLAGENLAVQRVRCPLARKGASSTLLGVLDAPIAYVGDEMELVFSPQATAAPIRAREIRGWQDGVYKILCGAVLRATVARHGGAFTGKVREAMLSGVDQQTLAYKWNMSTKTIARRLEQEGYTFRRLRDEVRMQKAKSLIHAGLSIETLSELLGYEDTRSFRRAFRRWFGNCPSAYRDLTVAAR